MEEKERKEEKITTRSIRVENKISVRVIPSGEQNHGGASSSFKHRFRLNIDNHLFFSDLVNPFRSVTRHTGNND